MEYKLMGILGYKHTKGIFFRYHPNPPPPISVIEKNDEEEKNTLHRI